MMHEKKLSGFAPRGVALVLFLLGSSGCAMLAKIGIGDDGAEPGSNLPDRDPVTSQRGGGAGEPPSSPKTCYGDTTANTHSCGFCGHDCGAAACEQGLCVPTTVTSAKDVRAVVVEENGRVFFTTDREIRSCTLGQTTTCASLLDVGLLGGLGGGATEGFSGDGSPGKGQNASSGNSLPSALDVKALALYGDRFFAADQGNNLIVSCPKAGCSATSIGAVKPRFKAAFAGGLAVNATLVAWGDVNGIGFGDLPGPTRVNTGDLVHYPLAHNVSRIEMIRDGTPIEDLIYRGTDGVFSLDGSIGATPKEIMAGSNIQDFALDATSVYLAIKEGGVMRFDRATRKLSPMADLSGWEVVHLVADAEGVYASIKSPLAAKLVRLRETFADTLAVGAQLGPIGLSKTWLYYATNTSLLRVAR